MPDSTRSQWLQTLEILASRQPDQAEAEWAWVMKELGLGPEYFLGVLEAVRQGRWREAENPAGYLKDRRQTRAEAADAFGRQTACGYPGAGAKNNFAKTCPEKSENRAYRY